MSEFSHDEAEIAIGQGSTWDTAADLTASNKGKKIHGRIQLSANRGEFVADDIGFGNFQEVVKELNLEVDVTMTVSMAYNNIWPQILANVLGTSTASPAEVTSGQGDYLHNIDLSSNNTGKFQTIAYLVETDKCVELPSVKWSGMDFSGTNNGVATFTARGIASRIITPTETPTNTAAEIADLSYEGTYEAAALGSFTGANHYFRMNAQAGGALSSGDNLGLMDWNLSINRPLERQFYLDGSASPYTKQPRHNGKIDGQFGFRFWKTDDAVRDWLYDWKQGTELKAELFLDASTVIGSGTASSFKFQMARLRPINLPGGFDHPEASGFAEPTPSYRIMKASAAPTGMSGVTCFRVAMVSARSVQLLN